MQYQWITGLILILSLLFLLGSAFLLIKRGWFVAWLKGTLGLVLLVAALFFAALSLNFYSYKQLMEESSVATVSFKRLSQQRYQATVAEASGREQTFDIQGDLWQLDARFMKWNGLLAGMGFTPGYKLDRIQGRYLSLEQERAESRTVYSLAEPEIGFDLWTYVYNGKLTSGSWIPWLDAKYGSATFLPMADGGIFSVTASNTGLVARAVNQRAEVAIEAWN
ncbi:MAG: hypothetical protein KUG82_02595 [Pseudomonadales bacterium]|nr:hypothetical protein [Pseudomonadales bacterium]